MDKLSFNYNEMQNYLKNRFPLLMIDSVEEVMPGKYAKGYKNVSGNDWFFINHFINDPKMPGVLLIEAMSQMAAMAIVTLDGQRQCGMELLRVDKAKFVQEVVPGDVLELSSKIIFFRNGLAKSQCCAYVKNKEVCAAEITLGNSQMLKENLPKAEKEREDG